MLNGGRNGKSKISNVFRNENTRDYLKIFDEGDMVGLYFCSNAPKRSIFATISFRKINSKKSLMENVRLNDFRSQPFVRRISFEVQSIVKAGVTTKVPIWRKKFFSKIFYWSNTTQNTVIELYEIVKVKKLPSTTDLFRKLIIVNNRLYLP